MVFLMLRWGCCLYNTLQAMQMDERASPLGLVKPRMKALMSSDSWNGARVTDTPKNFWQELSTFFFNMFSKKFSPRVETVLLSAIRKSRGKRGNRNRIIVWRHQHLLEEEQKPTERCNVTGYHDRLHCKSLLFLRHFAGKNSRLTKRNPEMKLEMGKQEISMWQECN